MPCATFLIGLKKLYSFPYKPYKGMYENSVLSFRTRCSAHLHLIWMNRSDVDSSTALQLIPYLELSVYGLGQSHRQSPEC